MAKNPSLAQFNKTVSDFATRVPAEKTMLFLKKISFEALSRLVQKTPVDTGRARGGWQVSFGKLAAGQVETTDKSGGGTIGNGSSKIMAMKMPVIVYIANNVHYILELEDGHSGQAPNGMMALTIQELIGMF